MIYLISYAATLLTLAVLDGLWLGVIARPLYMSQLADFLRSDPKIIAAAVFYLMYAACIVFLAVKPSLAAGSWKEVAFTGAVLGLAAYGAYEMTNYAVVKDWPVKISLIDWAWGIFITASASTIGYLVPKYFIS